jgi:PHS family inorganic phosphate transporter-like MFS transporter
LGLNSGIILQAIGFGTPPTKGSQGVYDNLRNICVGNLILSVAGLIPGLCQQLDPLRSWFNSIPGYWVSFLFIDSWGRKPIQLMGFIALTILFIIMGEYSPLRRGAHLAEVYGRLCL